MSAIKRRMEDLALRLEGIIERLNPMHCQYFLSNINEAVEKGLGAEELTEEWWDDSNFYDVALYCIEHGAYFGDSEVREFLYFNVFDKSEKYISMYGKEI